MEEDKANELKEGDVLAAMKQALDYAVQQSVVTAREAGQVKERNYPDHCILSAYAPSKKNCPYTQVRYQQTKYYCHRIAYRFGNNGSEIPQGFNISHLCHNHKCFNPKHLAAEAGADNRERACCRSAALKFSDYRCPHNPTCPNVPPCAERKKQKIDK